MSASTGQALIRRWLVYLPSLAVIASLVLVLGGWQLISLFLTPTQFPGFGRLLNDLWLIFTGGTEYNPVAQYSITFTRIFAAFLISMLAGSFIGILMGSNPVIEDYISTFTVIGLTIPSVFWAFLAVIWFGITAYVVPVFVIVVMIVPYVIVNMTQGRKDLDSELEEMSIAFNLSRWDTWRHIYLPHMTPYTFSTMRLAFALAWKLSLVAEVFGSNKGIGVLINSYYQLFRNDMVIAWALPMMIFMLVIEQIFEYLEHRSSKWRQNKEEDVTSLEARAV